MVLLLKIIFDDLDTYVKRCNNCTMSSQNEQILI